MTNTELISQARVAEKSGIRAYASQIWTKDSESKEFLKKIFDVKQINYTYFSRSYGLFKETLKIEGDEEQKVELDYKKKLKLNQIK